MGIYAVIGVGYLERGAMLYHLQLSMLLQGIQYDSRQPTAGSIVFGRIWKCPYSKVRGDGNSQSTGPER